jgi:SAM-dependent methyltransferase
MNATRRHYEEYWQRDRAPPDADPLTASRHALLWRYLERRSGMQTLLDCGAGTGGFVAEAAGRGLEAVGIELAVAARERAQIVHPDVKLVAWSLDEAPWPFPPASVDIVTSFEVIEHLLAPNVFFREAARVLRPRGVLCVSTPFHGRVKNVAIALLAFDRHYDVTGSHIRFFTDDRLRSMASEAGLRETEIQHLGRFWPLSANTVLFAEKS